MEFFRFRRSIPFMRHALVFNVVSIIVFLASVFLLATKGLHFSIEFTGGTVMEVSHAQPAEPDRIRAAIEPIVKDASVQNFGTSRDVLIRLGLPKVPEGANQNAEVQRQNDSVVRALKSQDPSVDVKRVDVVGGVVGKELATDGGLALLFVCIGIVIYLAFRFEWRFAV